MYWKDTEIEIFMIMFSKKRTTKLINSSIYMPCRSVAEIGKARDWNSHAPVYTPAMPFLVVVIEVI